MELRLIVMKVAFIQSPLGVPPESYLKTGRKMGKNIFMGEVSHTLSELQKEGKLLYYYKFPESKMASLVIADHLFIKNDKQVIFVEEKSSSVGKIGIDNLFGDKKLHQVKYNKELFPNHIYLFRFSENGSVYYTYQKRIEDLKGHRKHKSYISKEDFLIIYEGKPKLKTMLFSLL